MVRSWLEFMISFPDISGHFRTFSDISAMSSARLGNRVGTAIGEQNCRDVGTDSISAIMLDKCHEAWQGATVSKRKFRPRGHDCLAEAADATETRIVADTMDIRSVPP